jgi:hypothetical protein
VKVRQVEVSKADSKSAEIFFHALTSYYDLSEANALDMFARTGALTVTNYFYHVEGLDVWELNPDHQSDLEAFSPDEVKIGCSYKHLEECDKQYDLIVVDTPQGLHSDWQGVVHAEHFGVLSKLSRIMAERCIVVLYVNMAPYDKAHHGSQGYDEYEEYNFSEWMRLREDFYEGDFVVTEAQALAVYEKLFEAHGYCMKSALMIPCFSDVPGLEPYAFRLAIEVETFFEG